MFWRISFLALVWATCDPILSTYLSFPSSVLDHANPLAFDPLSKTVYLPALNPASSEPCLLQLSTKAAFNITVVDVPCGSDCDPTVVMFIVFINSTRMLYTSQNGPSSGTLFRRFDVALDGTLSLRTATIFIPTVSPMQLLWSEKNSQLISVSDAYLNGYGFAISLVDVVTWQVSVFANPQKPLVVAKTLSWMSILDDDNDILIARILATETSGCSFVIIHLKPIAIVQVLSTNYPTNIQTPSLFFKFSNVNYMLFSLRKGFLLFNYSSLADLNTSSPYVMITPTTHGDYYACEYVSPVNYVVCQAEYANLPTLDVFSVPDLSYVRSYQVNAKTNQSMLIADPERSFVFGVKSGGVKVEVGVTDLSHEICAANVLPSYTAPSQLSACGTAVPNCVPCAVGRALSVIQPVLAEPDLTVRVCQDCLPGFYSPNVSSSDCLACPLGSFSTSSGQSSCRQCLPGSVLSSISADNTTVNCTCQAGYRLAQFVGDLVLCERCPSDQYKLEAGDSQCKPCPLNSVSGEVDGRRCSCAIGFRQDPSTNLSNCLPCFDIGATCSNSIVVVDAGYWRPGVGAAPMECRPLEACGGGADYALDPLTNAAGPLISTCAQGYTGVLCGECADGWAKDSDLLLCVECSSPSPVYWCTSMLVALALAAYYVLVGSQPERRIQRNLLGVSLAVAYAQYLAQLTVPALMHINLSFLELQPSLFSGAICPLPASVLSAWVLKMFSLPFVLLLVVLITVIMTCAKHTKFQSEWQTRLVFSALGVIGLLFIGQAKHLFLVLLCRDVGNQRVLLLDPSTPCGSSVHVVLCVFAVLGILVLCAGLPLFQWLAVGGSSANTERGRRCAHVFSRPVAKLKTINADFTFLSVPFRTSTPWWEAIWTLRRASIVIIASLTPLDFASRSWFMSMSILAWLALHVRLSPLLSAEYNRMEGVMLVVLFFSFALEIAYHLHLSEQIVVAVLLLILNIPCVLYVVGTVAYQLFQNARKLVTTVSRLSRTESQAPSGECSSPYTSPSSHESSSDNSRVEVSVDTPLAVGAAAGMGVGAGLLLA